MAKEWLGSIRCDFCTNEITDHLFDARTRYGGSWATMCMDDWIKHRASSQLGTGHGQHYEKQPDGTFTKVEG